MTKPSTNFRSRVRTVRRLTSAICVACLMLWQFVGEGRGQDDTYKANGTGLLSINTTAVIPRSFIAVHGRRSLLDGYSESGLEVWAYPLQLLRGYRVGFRAEGTTSEIPGETILRRITYQPDAIVRTYIGPNFIVREKLFVPLDTPSAIITYTVDSRQPIDVVVHFVPVLNLMWPAAIGGQDTSWNSAASGYVMTEQSHRFSAVIGSTDVVSHDEIFNSTESSSTPGSLAFTVRAGGNHGNTTSTVVVAAKDNGTSKDTDSLVAALTHSGAQMEQRAVDHYRDLRAGALDIETPDETINRDLAWAEVAVDQAWVCNPYLGCGIVAGYGPSRGARRPQYAWFFAGDGMVAVDALLSAGEYSRAREELDFITKYQDPKTGMIWHEMSQSAGLIDWVGKYPYMFVHVDISFQYLNTVAAYVAASGDKKFLQDNWQHIQAAYHYCQSLIDSQDGLPRIPEGKEGGDEQDRMSDALTLSAGWVQASQSFANMATWMGNASLAAQAKEASEKARGAFAKHYWDEKEKFWIDGYSPSGKVILNRSSSGDVVFAQHLFSEEREACLLDQLASPNFQTDWGMRSNALNAAAFDPNSYAKGSVWAVGTASVAMAFWINHRPATAFPIWSGLIPWSALDSLGHMDEVLAGDYYHEQTESVPEQTWSSAAFLSSAVQGLLGLQVDGVTRQIVFAPQFPANWDAVKVKNVRLPSSTLDLSWSQTRDGSELEIVNRGAAAHLEYKPEIPLGARLTGARLNGRPIASQLKKYPQSNDATMELEIPGGTSHVILEYSGGVSLILPRVHPLLGDPSHTLKVIGVHLDGNTYTLDAQVDNASLSTFQLRTERKVVAVDGARWKAVSPETYELTIEPSSDSNHARGYRPVVIRVEFTPSP